MSDSTKKPGSSMQTGNSSAVGPPKGKLDKEVQHKIGQQLRAMYDEVVQQGVPDRFAELLRRLEKRDEGPEK